MAREKMAEHILPLSYGKDSLACLGADLDSMDYDKVWIDYEDGTGEWALVCDGVIYSIDALEGAGLDFGEYMKGEMLEPHGYKVYRRPLEGEINETK